VKAIDDYAFAYCGSLKSIALPDSVSVIYEAAFCGCTGLTNVFYTGTEEQWKKIPIVTRDNYDLTRAKIYYNCVSIEIDENGVEYVVTTDGKTDHYLRIQQRMQSRDNEMNFDFIELCPSSVYNNEFYPEDRW
jgi:hypothetical protein